MNAIHEWFRRNLANPQVVILILFIVGIAAIIFLMGKIIAPVLLAVVIAYLLEGLVGFFEGKKVPRIAAVLTIFIIFMVFGISVFLGIVPLVISQLSQAVKELPAVISVVHQGIQALPERFPELISPDHISGIMQSLQEELGALGQGIITLSMASIRNFVVFLVYMVLVPMMVLLFLKDKQVILGWLRKFMPTDSGLLTTVWRDVDRQIGNYIRGKIWEIIIVWCVSSITFSILGLRYPLLHGLIVGLSVLIPYVGAVIVFFPIIIVAFFQWGWSGDLLSVAIAYLTIQFVDGNILAPLLLSGVVNIHPVAVLVAILVFGNLWGILGIFFAIPLATLLRSIIVAWPHPPQAVPPGRTKKKTGVTTT
jgi:putative permease